MAFLNKETFRWSSVQWNFWLKIDLKIFNSLKTCLDSKLEFVTAAEWEDWLIKPSFCFRYMNSRTTWAWRRLRSRREAEMLVDDWRAGWVLSLSCLFGSICCPIDVLSVWNSLKVEKRWSTNDCSSIFAPDRSLESHKPPTMPSCQWPVIERTKRDR